MTSALLMVNEASTTVALNALAGRFSLPTDVGRTCDIEDGV